MINFNGRQGCYAVNLTNTTLSPYDMVRMLDVIIVVIRPTHRFTGVF